MDLEKPDIVTGRGLAFWRRGYFDFGAAHRAELYAIGDRLQPLVNGVSTTPFTEPYVSFPDVLGEQAQGFLSREYADDIQTVVNEDIPDVWNNISLGGRWPSSLA